MYVDRSRACVWREWGADPGDLASVRAERRERLVVVVGAACARAGRAHGVVRGAVNTIQAKGAVALAAALRGNTTLQTLNLSGMWTARTRASMGMGGRSRGTSRVRGWRGRERLVVVLGAACASAGS